MMRTGRSGKGCTCACAAPTAASSAIERIDLHSSFMNFLFSWLVGAFEPGLQLGDLRVDRIHPRERALRFLVPIPRIRLVAFDEVDDAVRPGRVRLGAFHRNYVRGLPVS